MTRTLPAGLIAAMCLACGGDDGDGNPGDGDAGVDAPLGPCDPLLPMNQQGCEVGQRCTWIVEPGGGRNGCVAEGTLPLGGLCEPSANGQPDRCASGGLCVSGVCQDICGFDATSGCPDGQSCARFAGHFAIGDATPFAGVCRPTCDPLTQERAGGGACDEGEACYLVTGASETVAVCAKAGTGAHDEDLAGPVFANSCVPGAQPRRKNSVSDTVQCGGLCKPIDSTRAAFGSEGGLNPDSCQTRWGTAAADDGGRGESCRFWSGREPFAALSPYSNSVGWCFKHVAFLYDPEGDGTLDWQFPRCAALTTDDVAPPIGDPPHNDAAYFWCIAMQGSRLPQIAIPQVLADRLAE